MKNREFWIDLPKKKNYDIMCFSDDQLLDKSVKDELIHVIDATGMPTKEEIRLAIEEFKALIKGRNAKFFIETKVPEVFEVIKWLEKLAAE